ncbi:unnamed protein product [Closterium sp. Yama58-4]|nr:unnamed protein product [Closterium sp. Yama58-4]
MLGLAANGVSSSLPPGISSCQKSDVSCRFQLQSDVSRASSSVSPSVTICGEAISDGRASPSTLQRRKPSTLFRCDGKRNAVAAAAAAAGAGSSDDSDEPDALEAGASSAIGAASGGPEGKRSSAQTSAQAAAVDQLLTGPPRRIVPIVPDDHKSGYVALIGQPNAGKSTLLNRLIGQKLSIVTQKPQTTRHRILGLVSAPAYQIILYDTPGVLSKSLHKLDDLMMQAVRTATVNADAVVLVIDITQAPQEVSKLLLEGMESAVVQKKPTLIVLNKKDSLKPGEVAKKLKWYQEAVAADGHKVIALSAKRGDGVDALLAWMLDNIPQGPAYYPKDVVSELPERFFVAEIVREKILLQYAQEVPYASQVLVRAFRERENAKDYISLDIMVERDSQKAILLGKEGKQLKALATAARMDIEEFLGREVFLEIRVKVKEKWRQDEMLLKEFGLDVRKRGSWY